MKKPATRARVLLLTSYTLPETAGSGINALRFACFINKTGDKANILTFNRNLKFKWKENILGVSIKRIPYFNKGILLKILSAPLVLGFFLYEILWNDVLIIYGGKTYAYESAIILGRILRRKLVFQSLLLGVDDLQTLVTNRKPFQRRFYKKLFCWVDTYFSINQSFSHYYHEIFKQSSRCLEIPQGVDTNIFHPISDNDRNKLRKILNLPNNKLLIVSIGFLIHRKGYQEIFDQLAKLEIDFLYCVIGDHQINSDHFLKSLRPEMEGLLERGLATLKDNIAFLPFISEVEQYLQCADVLIMNSYQEGLPNVLLEAMACHTPIIMRRLKGVSGFILNHNETALMYDDIKELPELIRTVLNDPVGINKMSDKARIEIREKYSFDIVYKTLLNHLQISNKE